MTSCQMDQSRTICKKAGGLLLDRIFVKGVLDLRKYVPSNDVTAQIQNIHSITLRK